MDYLNRCGLIRGTVKQSEEIPEISSVEDRMNGKRQGMSGWGTGSFWKKRSSLTNRLSLKVTFRTSVGIELNCPKPKCHLFPSFSSPLPFLFFDPRALGKWGMWTESGCVCMEGDQNPIYKSWSSNPKNHRWKSGTFHDYWVTSLHDVKQQVVWTVYFIGLEPLNWLCHSLYKNLSHS